MPRNDANFGIGTLAPNTNFRRERRKSIVLAFGPAVLDSDVVGRRPNPFQAAHGGMPQRNTRMDRAIRLEEPDRRPLRVLDEQPRRPPRRDMNSQRFIIRNSTRRLGVYPAGRD